MNKSLGEEMTTARSYWKVQCFDGKINVTIKENPS